MSRTAQQRLDAIEDAVKRGEEFQQRVRHAAGDTSRLADLMAEAIALAQEARGLEPVMRDGRATVCIEEIKAAHCMNDARAEYIKARGSNQPSGASP